MPGTDECAKISKSVLEAMDGDQREELEGFADMGVGIVAPTTDLVIVCFIAIKAARMGKSIKEVAQMVQDSKSADLILY